MTKYRVATSLLWPHYAVILTLFGNRYVFAHPAWWRRKDITPDYSLDANDRRGEPRVISEMVDLFYEYVEPVAIWPTASEVTSEILNCAKTHERRRKEEAAGILTLF
jgi:hypothetical protein